MLCPYMPLSIATYVKVGGIAVKPFDSSEEWVGKRCKYQPAVSKPDPWRSYPVDLSNKVEPSQC